jgi:hypothetical protein
MLENLISRCGPNRGVNRFSNNPRVLESAHSLLAFPELSSSGNSCHVQAANIYQILPKNYLFSLTANSSFNRPSVASNYTIDS